MPPCVGLSGVTGSQRNVRPQVRRQPRLRRRLRSGPRGPCRARRCEKRRGDDHRGGNRGHVGSADVLTQTAAIFCPESQQKHQGLDARGEAQPSLTPFWLRPSAGLKACPRDYTSPSTDRRHIDSALKMNDLDFGLAHLSERSELMARFMHLSFARGASSACLANVMENPSARRRGVWDRSSP